MKIDVVSNSSDEIKKKLQSLGFSSSLYIEDKKVYDMFNESQIDLTAYSGKDYDFVIRKGKSDIIYGLENEGFLLNKGLCSKLKENKIFVVFSFTSLVKAENMFKVYKNLLINGKLCNDYSVNCLYVSGASKPSELISSFQLISFATEFGYNYNNLKKSYEEIKKRLL